MDSDHIIGPLPEDIEMTERLKKSPQPTFQEAQEQLRRSWESRQTPEYQAKYGNIFYPEGAAKRRASGGFKGFTEEDLRAREEWNKFVEAWRKENGKPDQSSGK